jgi:hypothetical protein
VGHGPCFNNRAKDTNAFSRAIRWSSSRPAAWSRPTPPPKSRNAVERTFEDRARPLGALHAFSAGFVMAELSF